jgi:hypothetical protein
MSGFIRRIIGKTERMPTVLTDVLRESASFGQKMDEVPGNHANRRMPDDAFRGVWRQTLRFVDLLQKRVPAETRVLFEPISRRHMADAMAEQAA